MFRIKGEGKLVRRRRFDPGVSDSGRLVIWLVLVHYPGDDSDRYCNGAWGEDSGVTRACGSRKRGWLGSAFHMRVHGGRAPWLQRIGGHWPMLLNTH